MTVREPEPAGTDHSYRIEVWNEPPEAGGEIVEVIASSTSFAVSSAALFAAIRERPGKYIVHMTGRHRMTNHRFGQHLQHRAQATSIDPPRAGGVD